jgi:hypothetical protein
LLRELPVHQCKQTRFFSGLSEHWRAQWSMTEIAAPFSSFGLCAFALASDRRRSSAVHLATPRRNGWGRNHRACLVGAMVPAP